MGPFRTFYLLAGSARLHISGTETELRRGGVAVIPRNVPHAFLAGSDGARMLCLHTPGGGENFYRTASEPARAGEPPLAVDFDRIRQSAMAAGSMRVIGPPPFQPADRRMEPPSNSTVAWVSALAAGLACS